MKYAIAILICLTLGSVVPKLSAMRSVLGAEVFVLGHRVGASMAWLFHLVASVPQTCWLITIGIVLIGLSWFVRRQALRSAAQRSR